MHTKYSVLFGLFMASTILCAPMASLDADVFTQNGKEAQALNAQFANLDASDPCTSGDMACIGASLAHCVNGTWSEEACPEALSCFALPSLREAGTVLSCTSNTTALAVIKATGVTGGIAVNSTDGAVDFPTDCDGNDSDEEDNSDEGDSGDTQSATSTTAAGTRAQAPSSPITSVSATTSAFNTDATPSPSGSGDAETMSSKDTVTVTVTAAPTAISTEFSETTTLDRSQASSFLSSIATDTNFSIVETIRSTPAPTNTANEAPSATSDATQSTTLSSKPVGVASPPAASSITSDFGARTTIILQTRSISPATTSTAVLSASTGDAEGGSDSY